MCGGPISRHRNTKVDDELPDCWDALVNLIKPRYNVQLAVFTGNPPTGR
jgi:hypothetical protein